MFGEFGDGRVLLAPDPCEGPASLSSNSRPPSLFLGGCLACAWGCAPATAAPPLPRPPPAGVCRAWKRPCCAIGRAGAGKVREEHKVPRASTNSSSLYQKTHLFCKAVHRRRLELPNQVLGLVVQFLVLVAQVRQGVMLEWILRDTIFWDCARFCRTYQSIIKRSLTVFPREGQV